MTQQPFSIRVFLPDGDPDGLQVVEKSNWTGVGVVLPRALFGTHRKRTEFGHTGIYVLAGPSEDSELPTIYIGEGDPIRPRLDSHSARKDFWTRCIFFVTKDNSLNKAHGQYLEARLIKLAQTAKRCRLDNVQTPQLSELAEWEIADLDSFLADVRAIFPLLGLNIFDQPKATRRTQPRFYIKAKGIIATGHEAAEGFVVEKGSEAVTKEVRSIHRYMTALRRDLLATGALVQDGDRYFFVQDYAFNSPSTAAGVVQARTANGRIDWKDKDGRTLKERQEADTSC